MRGTRAKQLRQEAMYDMKDERKSQRLYNKVHENGSLECPSTGQRSLYRELKKEYKNG